MFRSVSGSSALVASSRISRVGRSDRALASSRRCRWPPLKLRPPSSTPLLRPPGLVAIRSNRAASRSAETTTSSGTSSLHRVRLSRTVPSNRVMSWSTYATDAATTSLGRSSLGRPSSSTRPEVGT